MNAFILAGGRSTRMGRDKALLKWHGRTLIEHALDKMRALNTHPRILGSRPDLGCFAPVIPDNFPGRGPLGGIEAALSLTDTDLNLFLPVDLPLLPMEFLRWMIARAAITNAVATIPSLGGRPHPLCAIYHRRLLPGIRAGLAQGDAKVMRIIDRAAAAENLPIDSFQVEYIAAAQRDAAAGSRSGGGWPRHLPVYMWFENLNTPDDIARIIGA